jgi:hypothetical protein
LDQMEQEELKYTCLVQQMAGMCMLLTDFYLSDTKELDPELSWQIGPLSVIRAILKTQRRFSSWLLLTLPWCPQNSFADHGEGSCWQPIPPAGYKALGDIMVKGRSKPVTYHDLVPVMVKESCTMRYPDGLQYQLWNDK